MFIKAIFLLLLIESQSYSHPIVATINGVIEGRTYHVNGKIMNSFKGIPYAEPPIGKLRFRKPLPKSNWSQTYNASDFKRQCIQSFGTNFTSEDCLYLNIWSPNLNQTAKLPVMFWIHGGGLIIGSASESDNGSYIYDGTQLALKGVIVVTINYRLGIFGFLCSGRSDAPGNMGFWDQAMALSWVNQNVQAFGGNPNDITIFGQSAGGMSVSALILSPVTMNLFQKAILQSGSLYTKLYFNNKNCAFEFSRDFARNSTYFGNNTCIDDETWIGCLRNKTAEELNDAQTAQYQSRVKYSVIGILFQPCYPSEFLPNSTVNAIRYGIFKTDIKLFMGHTHLEGLVISTWADQEALERYNPRTTFSNITRTTAKNDIKKVFVLDNSTFGDELANIYTKRFSDSDQVILRQQDSLRLSVCDSGGDYTLTCPTILFGAKLAIHPDFKGKVYQYRLTYANSRSIAYGSHWAYVTHGDDLPLVFGRPLHENGWTDDDRNMSSIVVDIWTHFAKHGSPPNLNGNRWPEYSRLSDGSPNASYLELNPNSDRLGKSFADRYKGNDCSSASVINNCIRFWDQILIKQFDDNSCLLLE